MVCVTLAARQVDPRRLWDELLTLNPLLLVPAAACTFVGYATRTVRWRSILGQDAPCEIRALFSILMIGFTTNNLVPARLGELVRAFLLSRRTGVRKTFALATIFLERLFDGLALVTLLSVLAAFFIDLPGWGREVELFSVLVFVGIALAIAVILVRPDVARVAFETSIRPLPNSLAGWGRGAAAAFFRGLSSMRRPTVLGQTAALSLAVWVLEWASYAILSSGFQLGLSGPDAALACAFLLVVVNLGIMIPSSPGYVGTFQFFGVEALKVFGVAPEVALAFMIVAHLSQYIVVTSIGIALILRQHLSLSGLTADATRDAESTDDPMSASA